MHPALRETARSLSRHKRQWFAAEPRTPLQWYAAAQGWSEPLAALLAARLPQLPAATKQIWIATAFHALLLRDRVQVVGGSRLGLSEAALTAVADRLNPLLHEDGIELLPCGQLLLACADRLWRVDPLPFAAIEGKSLPNRHQPGVDGGKWARLHAEIQMLLGQSAIETAQPGMAINGLWLWGGAEFSAVQSRQWTPAVTSDAELLSLLPAAWPRQPERRLAILDADSVAEYLARYPKPLRGLLLGAGYGLDLTPGSLFSLPKRNWQPPATLATAADLDARLVR